MSRFDSTREFHFSALIIKESRVHGVLEDIREHVLLNLHSIEKNLQFWQSKSETDSSVDGSYSIPLLFKKLLEINQEDSQWTDCEIRDAINSIYQNLQKLDSYISVLDHVLQTVEKMACLLYSYSCLSSPFKEKNGTMIDIFYSLVDLKHCVQTFNVFDFLKDILNKVPDLGGSGATGDDRSIPKKRKIAEDDDNDSDEEQKRNKMLEARNTSGRGRSRGRGRGRGRGHRTADHDYEMISHVNKMASTHSSERPENVLEHEEVKPRLSVSRPAEACVRNIE
ncbi:hypothetical protein HN51_049267 [Arachis hypogaea]